MDLREAFIKLDTNQDGALTVDELANGLGNLQLFELLQNHGREDEDQFQHIMQQVDLDGDGRIDYAEFIQAAIDHKHLLNKQNLEIAFDMFDLNHDGQISIDELKAMFSDNIINSASGDELVKMIKAWRPEMIVIMVTADLSPEIERDCMQNGASICLSKPINFGFLKETIRNLLNP